MSEQVEQVERVRVRDQWSRFARITGWVLFVAWFAVGAALLFVGEARSSFGQLEAEVAAGEVTEVRVSEGLEPGAKGFAIVEVRWSKGPFRYLTQVVEANPRDRGSQQPQNPDVTARILPTTADRLHEIDPDVRVTQTDDRLSGELFGRSVPSRIVFPALFLMLLTILYLIASPPTWRATKWAWFWLLGVFPPVGILLFLAFGGPTRVLPPPRTGARQLTGGWAFLLSLVLGSIFLSANR